MILSKIVRIASQMPRSQARQHVPIGATVVAQLKRYLGTRRSGYGFQIPNGLPLRESNIIAVLVDGNRHHLGKFGRREMQRLTSLLDSAWTQPRKEDADGTVQAEVN